MHMQSRSSLLCVAGIAVMLLACGAADDPDKNGEAKLAAQESVAATPTSAPATTPAADGLVDWKITWAPATTNEDKTSIKEPPTYELQMADDEKSQGWKVVWTGTTTSAQVRAPPGHHCFRAVTVVKKAHSEPSVVICATK